jgi:hypothetical protein
MKTKLILIAILALAGSAKAVIFENSQVGRIDLSGTFTLNHLYNFNNPRLQPFGWFSPMEVQNAPGIFAPYVSPGDILGMPTNALEPLDMATWTIGGYTFDTTNDVFITGADFVGRDVLGLVDLSGNGFDPSIYPNGGAYTFWQFNAPPYDIDNFPEDITRPIDLQIIVFYRKIVPDTGTSMVLFAIGIIILLVVRVKSQSRGVTS